MRRLLKVVRPLVIAALLLAGVMLLPFHSNPEARTGVTADRPDDLTGPVNVALVFGKNPACAGADTTLVVEVAEEAVKAGLSPRILAATVSVESGCNQWAVSRSGAVGYMQVVPKVWKAQYDLAGRYNLFNGRDNLRVGASILADSIRRYGVAGGIRRYNGTGTGCDACDAGYVDKIEAAAGQR